MITWYLYIVRCSDTSLYTGITTDVTRRFSEHAGQGKRCAKYLRGKDPLCLVFKKRIGSIGDALRMERRVKNLSRAEKEKLVAKKRRLPAFRPKSLLVK